MLEFTALPLTTEISQLLKEPHHESIALCVRWYVTYKRSDRDVVEMMAERHVELAHPTILRWVQRDIPEFAKRWQHDSRPVRAAWRCDETSIRITG